MLKQNGLFTFKYYLKLSQKTRPNKKNGFYHENAKPELIPKEKKTQQ